MDITPPNATTVKELGIWPESVLTIDNKGNREPTPQEQMVQNATIVNNPGIWLKIVPKSKVKRIVITAERLDIFQEIVKRVETIMRTEKRTLNATNAMKMVISLEIARVNFQ